MSGAASRTPSRSLHTRVVRSVFLNESHINNSHQGGLVNSRASSVQCLTVFNKTGSRAGFSKSGVLSSNFWMNDRYVHKLLLVRERLSHAAVNNMWPATPGIFPRLIHHYKSIVNPCSDLHCKNKTILKPQKFRATHQKIFRILRPKFW